jgi:hypothetical protein
VTLTRLTDRADAGERRVVEQRHDAVVKVLVDAP